MYKEISVVDSNHHGKTYKVAGTIELKLATT